MQKLDLRLQAGAEGRRDALPAAAVLSEAAGGAAALFRIATDAGQKFDGELVFPPQQIALFRTKSAREGELARSMQPPVSVAATAARDSIEIVWQPPASLDVVRAKLREQPLLRLGFRVYRWREGEEPHLLSSFGDQQTQVTDRDLPLWRARFFYCVATVLEGTIGDLPTLIESKRSSVITVETLENFTVDVVGGSAEHARVRISTSIDGAPREETIEVGAGDRITKVIERGGKPFDLDTGLVVKDLVATESASEETVDRPEFLPDGRRKLDPETGAPSFRKQKIRVPTRTLVLHCSEPSGVIRSFTSPALH
jgi:hypothetical protein